MKNVPLKNKLTHPQIKALAGIWGEIGENNFSRHSGFSMWPFVKPGDILIISHQVDDIKLGEIVVFLYQEKLVAHRVVKRIKYGPGKLLYLTKGDRNSWFDRPALPMEDILGRVVQIHGSSTMINYSSLLWRIQNYFIALLSCSVADFLNLLRGTK